MCGVKMSFDYIALRKTKRTVKYKLRKRTEKVLEMINRYKVHEPLSILDVGAADGAMLRQLKNNLNTDICLGIEPSVEYINSRSNDSPQIIQAIGEKLPFKSNSFDVVVAASVFDHMGEPAAFLRECRRILKKEGIVIVTLISPFYDALAVKLKIKEDDHVFHFSEGELARTIRKENFDVVSISRFALPFFGIFFERFFDNMFRAIGMKWLMFYIIAVGRNK